MTTREQLIKKYDVPVPRYTSYPTVPLWNTDNFTLQTWLASAKRAFDESNITKGISLYIHLPFCESLCTYCACNTRITKNHKVEGRYLEAVVQEWNRYCDLFGEKPIIRELHIGGGTPTFFSPENLSILIGKILEKSIVHDEHEFSVEGHPNNTTEEHLRALYALGFRRVSFGVQDLDPVVQKAINRIQPFENLEKVTNLSRTIGYKSISYDLVYGLPYQTIDTIGNTIDKTLTLMPDRISFYSYAHVPWLRPGQRGYEDADLPGDVVKRSLYEKGRTAFQQAGYREIGMDHFALPHDALCHAQDNGHLHRNFMGYTITQTELLIGLGVSSISDAKYAYAQNVKKVEEYYRLLSEDIPVFKGHLMSDEDRLVRKCILQLSCFGRLSHDLLNLVMDEEIEDALSIMKGEGIIRVDDDGLIITADGRPFIRNICAVFDKRMKAEDTQHVTGFSKAI